MTDLKVSVVKVSSLRPDPENARTHDTRNLAAIRSSLERFGQRRPLVVWGDVVIAGNGTLEAAKSLGWERIAVARVPAGWSAEEARAYALVDNRSAELAAWDAKVLAEQLVDLDAVGWDLAELGFEPLEPPGEGLEDEGPLEFPADPVTKLGDVWRLGRHRVMCGDMADDASVARLLDGDHDAAIVTDPPFGIKYRSNMKGSVPREIVGDGDTALRDRALSMRGPDHPIACFATWRCVPPRAPRGQLIWAKNVGGMGDLDFPWSTDYEVVWVYGKGWSGHRGSAVLRGETVVTWNSGPAKREHPHQKPVEVLRQIIEKAPTGPILDPFLGSGSTLMAAEREDRACYGMEIDPAYVDVVVRRWENLTGETAVRVSDA